MNTERGFSKFKLLLLLGIVATMIWMSFTILPVYVTYWKVQDAFESITRSMADKPAIKIRRKYKELFRIKYIDMRDIPDEFYDNLEITSEEGHVTIESFYEKEVWYLGPLKMADPDDFDPDELEGMDKLRYKGLRVYEFNPYAETP